MSGWHAYWIAVCAFAAGFLVSSALSMLPAGDPSDRDEEDEHETHHP